MRHHAARLAVIAGLLATAAAAQTGPRTAPPAQVGRVLAGKLSGTETEARHPLRLAAGDTVRITARGRGFDAVVKLYGPTGDEPLVEDDDGGGGLIAELTYTAERAGLYRVAVGYSGATGEGEGDGETRTGGDYDLTVIAAPRPVVSPVRPIALGATPIDVDMAQCSGGCRFTFDARAGDRIIAQTSADDAEADPVLELSTGGAKVAEDDDNGEGVNARIVHRAERAGTYTLLARSLNGKGRFKLAVAARAHTPRPAVALAVGTPASGRLTDDAEVSSEGRFYDAYTLTGRAGQRLVIDMASDDFDAAVSVVGDTVLGQQQLAYNDDAEASAPGRTRPRALNSRLVLTFERAGTVEVRAMTISEQGAYTLRVSEQAAR